MSSPHGPAIRSIEVSSTPSSRSRSRFFSWFRRPPISADIERIARERQLERRQVELVVVGEEHDRGGMVGCDLGERLLRPGDDQLVGARDPLPRCELGTGVGDDRRPAEQVRRRGERLGRVDRAVDQQSGRRPVHLGEDLPALELEHPVARAADQLLRVGG